MKIIKTFFATTLFLFLALGQVQAAGLVPCGGPGEKVCGFCDIFVTINGIIQFIIIKIVPTVAVLMLVIGGAMWFLGGVNPKYLQTGKNIITTTLIGLVIIFTAFLVIGTVLSAIGLTGWTHDFYKNWWSEGFFQIPGC